MPLPYPLASNGCMCASGTFVVHAYSTRRAEMRGYSLETDSAYWGTNPHPRCRCWVQTQHPTPTPNSRVGTRVGHPPSFSLSFSTAWNRDLRLLAQWGRVSCPFHQPAGPSPGGQPGMRSPLRCVQRAQPLDHGRGRRARRARRRSAAEAIGRAAGPRRRSHGSWAARTQRRVHHLVSDAEEKSRPEAAHAWRWRCAAGCGAPRRSCQSRPSRGDSAEAAVSGRRANGRAAAHMGKPSSRTVRFDWWATRRLLGSLW